MAPPRPVSVALGPDSIFTPARDRMLHLARVYPVDRVLAVFRANAGLDTRGAEPPGNWEDFGHPHEQPWGEADYPGREHAPSANLLRGHYGGHFLSMLAKAYAATGEAALRAKVTELVDGLAEVQTALAATGRYSHPGFLAAYGEWQFSRLEAYAPYGEVWAPWYTAHKIMAGLLDAHELAGSDRALHVVTAMGKWAHARLAPLPDEQRQKTWSLYIAGEFGGMNETLARLAAVTGEAVFLETARYFDQQNLLEAGAEGRDVLDGMHANQHLPQLIGYVHEYRATGERTYLQTARTLFRQVVPGRMYAHGGTGEGELWGPPETVAGDIGERNAETCAAYNLVKLARELLVEAVRDGDEASAETYADYVERAVTNQVLGSRSAVDSDVSPEVTYMFPVNPGAVREYDNAGTCCGGTGLENHVTHQDSVAIEAGGDLWVQLYTDATVSWTSHGIVLRIETEGPRAGRVRIHVEEAPDEHPREKDECGAGRLPGDLGTGVHATVHLHVPRWVRGHARVRVDGRSVPLEPGTFHALDRWWRRGDVVEMDVPAAVIATPTIDDPALFSLSSGPTVYLARSPLTTTLVLPLEGLLEDGDEPASERGGMSSRVGAEYVTWNRDGTFVLLGTTFEPCWSGGSARYHMYVRASDAAGATGAVRIVSDAAPAPSGWFTTPPGLRVEMAEELAGRPIEVRVGESEWVAYSGSIDLPGDGTYRVEARIGASGGSEYAMREIAVDTAPPVTRAEVKDLGTAVEVTLSAEDDGSGVDRVQWEGPGTFWATFHEAFVRTLSEAEQVIEFAATDRAGNQEARQRLVLPARPE